MPDVSPRVVAFLPRFCPSTWIYIVKPLVALHETGRVRARITLESMASPRDVLGGRPRGVLPQSPARRSELLRAAVAAGLPVIYDLDDNFFEIPLDTDTGRDYAQPDQLAMLTEYLTAASLVRVYSRPLLEHVQRLNPRVEWIAGAVDLRQVKPPAAKARRTAEAGLRDQPARRFTGGNIPARRAAIDQRIRAADRSPFLGATAAGRPARRTSSRRCTRLRSFPPPFFRLRLRHRLGALPDDLLHRSKSNTKFREYGACGIAGIYSDVDVYSDCVRQGETGLLVSNDSEAWYRAMRQLVDDAQLRHTIQQQARREIENRYSQEIFAAVFLRQIERLVDGGRRSQAAQVDGQRSRKQERRSSGLFGLLPRGFEHLRRHGWARCWNSLRWMGSSGWSMARLQWRLRK